MYTLLPWLWHLLGAERAGRKSGIVWSPSVFSRRFRGSCRNPDEVHGTLTARRQFPIRFSVGTDPDKKVSTLPRDRPTNKDKGVLVRIREMLLAADRLAPECGGCPLACEMHGSQTAESSPSEVRTGTISYWEFTLEHE